MYRNICTTVKKLLKIKQLYFQIPIKKLQTYGIIPNNIGSKSIFTNKKLKIIV
jgi:hypothetical protein